MNAVTSSRAWHWVLLPFVITSLASCSDTGKQASPSTVPTNAPSNADSLPIVQGLGGSTGEPAISDTIDMRKIGYSRGAEDAAVTVYEFSDFGCPYCGQFARESYPGLHKEFVETGKVRWTYVPFVMGMFPNGGEAARAAECAAEEERFWEMHDLLYTKQSEWKASRNPASLFKVYAEELRLDGQRFASCYSENRGGARTALNTRAADALSVRATPSFFINGRLVEGALPASQFRQLLNSLLVKP